MIEQKPPQQDDKNKDSAVKPIGMGGSTGAAPSGRVASFSSGGGQQTLGSGRFTNLQKYIGANQGAGQQLQQRVTGGLEQNIKKTEQEATSQNAQIANNIKDARTGLAEDKINATTKQVQDDPTQLANNQESLNQFQQMMTGQNLGGTIANQTQQAQSQLANQAQQQQQNIGQLANEQGRFNLLKNAVKQPNYSTGQQRLDQLFMQTQGGRGLEQAQQNLQKNLGNVQSQLASEFGKQAEAAKALTAREEAVSKQLSDSLIDAGGKFANDLTKRTGELNFQRQKEASVLDTYLKGGKVAPEDMEIVNQALQSAGLHSGMRTYDVLSDPNKAASYFQKGKTNLTESDVIDQAGLDRYTALSKLAGIEPEKYAYKQAGDIGTGSSYKGQDLLNAIKQRRTELDRDINDLQLNSKYKNTTATADASDLLNYLEGNFGNKTTENKYIVPSTGYISPINLKTGGSRESGKLLMGDTVGTNYGSSFTPDAKFISTEGVGWGEQAGASLLENFIKDLDTKYGYGSTLGGTNEYFTLPSDKKVKLF